MLGIKTFTVRATLVLKRLLFEPNKKSILVVTQQKLPRHFLGSQENFGYLNHFLNGVERGL